MKKTLALLSLAAVCSMGTAIAQDHHSNQNQIKRVLLISVDGMHAVDFLNCANGISTINNGKPYCPAMGALGFLPWLDGDRHRRKSGLYRRLLRRCVFPKLLRSRENHRQRSRGWPVHPLRRAHRDYNRI
jgi:hypothetical protein